MKPNHLPSLYGSNIVPGVGPMPCDLMLVGEAPGKDEDEALKPFVGKAGKKLDEALEASGVKRSGVYITNAVKCRPPSNRTPTWEEILKHRDYLINEIGRVDPKIIVTLGTTATRAVLLRERLSDSLVVLRYKMLFRTYPKVCKVQVTYHPAACFYGPSIFDQIVKDLKRSKKWLEEQRLYVLK